MMKHLHGILRACLLPLLLSSCLLPGRLAIAAESAGSVGINPMPDSLHFGTLSQDATLIAGIRFSVPDASGNAANPEILLPPFLRILEQRASTDTDSIDWILRLAANTGSTGTFHGQIRVRAGLLSASVPVDLVIIPRNPTTPRLLVLDTPWTHFGFEDGSLIRPWLEVVHKSGVTADYVWLHEGKRHEPLPDLQPFSTVLISGESLSALVEPEMAQLRRFATNGGRLLVFANRFFVGSVPAANRLLGPLGLKWIDREPTNPLRPEAEGMDRYSFRLGAPQLHDHPLVQGLRSLHATRPSPIQILPDAAASRPVASLPGQSNAHFSVHTPIGSGDAIAVGITLWATMPSEPGAEGTDNTTFLGRLLNPRTSLH